MEQKSSIIAIGLSVHHTPVDIREKLSIPQVERVLAAQPRHLSRWGDPCCCDQPSRRRCQQSLALYGLLNIADRAAAISPYHWQRCYTADSTYLLLQAEWPRAIEELTSFPHIEEAAVLSTCNRMELYVVALSWHRVSHS